MKGGQALADDDPVQGSLPALVSSGDGDRGALQGGTDGCFFNCSFQNARGAVHTFSAWSPQPNRSPLQHAFISLVHRLAVDTIREPTMARLLRQLGGYL
jgi:hypothetical protein